MNTNARSIPEMVAERKSLARQQSEINRKLEALDNELFSKLEAALDAFGVKAPVALAPPAIPLPTAPVTRVMPAMPAPLILSNPSRAKASPRQGEIGLMIQMHTRAFLVEAGKPLATGEILDRLTARGVEIPGKDKRNNLSAHLSRSSSFARKGNGWWFAEKQEPPVGGS